VAVYHDAVGPGLGLIQLGADRLHLRDCHRWGGGGVSIVLAFLMRQIRRWRLRV
jgi:hypothetical protein